MPSENELLKRKLIKFGKEFCRQSIERRDRESANLEKVRKILNEGGSALDPDLRDLGDQLLADCPPFNQSPAPGPGKGKK